MAVNNGIGPAYIQDNNLIVNGTSRNIATLDDRTKRKLERFVASDPTLFAQLYSAEDNSYITEQKLSSIVEGMAAWKKLGISATYKDRLITLQKERLTLCMSYPANYADPSDNFGRVTVLPEQWSFEFNPLNSTFKCIAQLFKGIELASDTAIERIESEVAAISQRSVPGTHRVWEQVSELLKKEFPTSLAFQHFEKCDLKEKIGFRKSDLLRQEELLDSFVKQINESKYTQPPQEVRPSLFNDDISDDLLSDKAKEQLSKMVGNALKHQLHPNHEKVFDFMTTFITFKDVEYPSEGEYASVGQTAWQMAAMRIWTYAFRRSSSGFSSEIMSLLRSRYLQNPTILDMDRSALIDTLNGIILEEKKTKVETLKNEIAMHEAKLENFSL